jgi:hypothetical protein
LEKAQYVLTPALAEPVPPTSSSEGGTRRDYRKRAEREQQRKIDRPMRTPRFIFMLINTPGTGRREREKKQKQLSVTQVKEGGSQRERTWHSSDQHDRSNFFIEGEDNGAVPLQQKRTRGILT